MLIYTLNFLLGIVIFSLKSNIHISTAEWSIFVLTIIIITAAFIYNKFKLLAINIIIFLLGFIWMWGNSYHVMSHKVAPQYLNKNIIIEGHIIDLTKTDYNNIRFNFKTEKPFKANIKLAWYASHPPLLKTGDKWQLLVKLKHNNGMQNLGGFDYEKWLFYENINATGYVKTADLNKLIKQKNKFSIDIWRQLIREKTQVFLQDKKFGGVINAIIIGDRSLMKKANWELFRATNTTHLSVVSGLHIGLIYSLVFLLVSFLWRYTTNLSNKIPAKIIASYFGISIAFLYALIAGFAIPTERAIIMASVVFLATILQRNYNTWHLYAVSLILVLLINPISVFNIGFWLSFYVVAIIIYTAMLNKNRSFFYKLMYMQLIISITTIPLLYWFFAQGSVLSPLANLIAIPIFSLVTIPISLIGALLTLLNLDYMASIAFEIGNQSIVYLAYFLEFLQNLSINQWSYSQQFTFDFIISLAAIFIMLLPKGLKLRRFSILFIALLLLSPTKEIAKNSVLITVFDVGQGLASIIRTKNHTLLFDTGGSSPNGFSIGESVINPYLLIKKINYLDKIIISHADNDHAGGLDKVLAKNQVVQIMTSAPNKIKHSSVLCVSGQSWVWDGILFEILNPENNLQLSSNNASCVLKVSNDKYSILLTADIEKKTEKYLIKNNKNKLLSDIMLAPHHGSKTSSTEKFIKAVAAKTVIISSGFRNRFNHPHQTIIKRYKENNLKIINTNCAGQIDIKLDNKISISQYRKKYKRYYMRQCEINT